MSLEIFDKGEAYLKRLREFRKKCKELVHDSELMRPFLQAISRDILQHDHLCPIINILGVGSGDGTADIEIVIIVKKELRKHELHRQRKIHTMSVEPNAYSCEEYKESLNKLPIPLRDGNTTFDILTKSFEEFQAKEEASTKFHIVHFVHSMYFLDIEKTLMHCFDNLLLDNGKILCIVTGNGDLIYQMCHTSAGVQLLSTDEIITLDHVLEVVTKHGWKYQESTIEFTIDVTDVFDEDSVEGNYLLDFLTQTLNFRLSADEETINETLNMVKELTTTENGKRVGKKIDNLIIIEK